MAQRPTISEIYRDKAAQCRRLARATTDYEIAQRLLELAKEFDQKAAEAENNEERNLS